MIMDTLAALALATERPHPSIIRTPPTRKGDLIITPVMWRQIYGISLYMVFVMIIQLAFSGMIWGLDYVMVPPEGMTADDITKNDS
jgi:magnesium-transporting ATPase (P-type)